jgi:hypothetical protein
LRKGTAEIEMAHNEQEREREREEAVLMKKNIRDEG